MNALVMQGLFVGPSRGRSVTRGNAVQAARSPRLTGVVAQLTAGGAFPIDPTRVGIDSGGGRPLPDLLRGKMEAAMGADFSQVRIHVGPQAERIGAIAFTLGADIYFAPGRYQPDTAHGQQLLGHELAHVVQQRQGRVRNPLGGGVAVVQDHALEAEADRLGHRAAAYRLPAAQARMGPGAAQAFGPVTIAPPVAAGPGRLRVAARAGGREIGSVLIHARDRTTAEVTNLGVDAAHREHGVGKMLLASAARAGLRMGRSRVALAAQDNGSGRLTKWYQSMGFMPLGERQNGYQRLEASASRLMAGAGR